MLMVETSLSNLDSSGCSIDKVLDFNPDLWALWAIKEKGMSE